MNKIHTGCKAGLAIKMTRRDALRTRVISKCLINGNFVPKIH